MSPLAGPRSRRRLGFLGTSGRRIVARLAEDLVPIGDAETDPVRPEQVARQVDRTFAPVGRDLRVFLRICLHGIDLLPIVISTEVGRYSRLPSASRRRFLERLEGHGSYALRSLYRMWKSIVLFAYYGTDPVRRRLGYDPDRVLEGSRAGRNRPGLAATGGERDGRP